MIGYFKLNSASCTQWFDNIVNIKSICVNYDDFLLTADENMAFKTGVLNVGLVKKIIFKKYF